MNGTYCPPQQAFTTTTGIGITTERANGLPVGVLNRSANIASSD